MVQQNDEINITDRTGTVLARVGDMVRLSGRLVWPWRDHQEDSDHAREIARSVPDECHGPYYLVGDEVTVVNANEPVILSPPGSGLYFQRQSTERWTGGIVEIPEQVISGVFQISRDGNCIVMTDTHSQERFVPMWPAGFNPNIDSEGEFEVRNGGGRTIVHEGGRLRMIGYSVGDYISECDARLWRVKAVSNPDFPIAFPQSSNVIQGYDYREARLEVHNGCIYLGLNILIFPPDFSMSEEEGQVRIKNERGVIVAREGQRTTFKGSFVSPDDNLGRQMRKTLPLDCPHGSFWFVD